MDVKDEKFQEQFSEARVFVDELIYQNIKLLKENLGLTLDNDSLRQRVEELEGERELSKGSITDDININVRFSMVKGA
jgi:regulator of replication initiation timing